MAWWICSVVKKVGELYLLACTSPHSKSILVHVDCVKALTVNDRLVSFHLKIGVELPFSTPVSEDESGPVLLYCADLVLILIGLQAQVMKKKMKEKAKSARPLICELRKSQHKHVCLHIQTSQLVQLVLLMVKHRSWVFMCRTLIFRSMLVFFSISTVTLQICV